MPKYDFRCDGCSHLFELTRSFSQSSDPAMCPHDGASATRLFSPPLDLLVYGREPIVDTRRPTIPPGALSCHDHGPSPSEASQHTESAEPSGSRWHAVGYAAGESGQRSPEPSPARASFGSRVGSHGHGHSHGPGAGHRH